LCSLSYVKCPPSIYRTSRRAAAFVYARPHLRRHFTGAMTGRSSHVNMEDGMPVTEGRAPNWLQRVRFAKGDRRYEGNSKSCALPRFRWAGSVEDRERDNSRAGGRRSRLACESDWTESRRKGGTGTCLKIEKSLFAGVEECPGSSANSLMSILIEIVSHLKSARPTRIGNSKSERGKNQRPHPLKNQIPKGAPPATRSAPAQRSVGHSSKGMGHRERFTMR